MQAYICTQFGPPEVLKLSEVDWPVLKDNQVLIKVKATSVNAADCNLRGFTYIPSGLGWLARLMVGMNKPKTAIQGSVLAGEVVEIGKNVKSFKVSDKVYGTGPEFGGYAEYGCMSESGAITTIPENISFEEAATVPYGAMTALYFLNNMITLKQGQKVLVKGASGGVGVYAVQLANYFGAEVTGVCSSKNIEFVKSLGASHVIDYTKEDFTKTGSTWDVIFDVVVKKTSFGKARKVLNKNGVYLAVAGGLADMLYMVWTSLIGGKKVKFGGGSDSEIKENLEFISGLISEEKIRPVLDKTFGFSDLVEAHHYVESGHKRGNIAVTIQS